MPPITILPLHRYHTILKLISGGTDDRYLRAVCLLVEVGQIGPSDIAAVLGEEVENMHWKFGNMKKAGLIIPQKTGVTNNRVYRLAEDVRPFLETVTADLRQTQTVRDDVKAYQERAAKGDLMTPQPA